MTRTGTASATGSRTFSAWRTFARAGAAPLDVDAIAGADPRGSRRPQTSTPSAYRRTPRRQAVPADLPADRARSRRPHQGSARLDGRSGEARAHHPRRGADRRGVLLLRQGAGRRRTAGRHERTRRVPAVRRDRFAGRRVAADAPRLPRDFRPLPQLSDPVARIAGEGARAGRRC